MKTQLFLLVLLTAGCSKYTAREKALLGSMVAAQVWDYESTRKFNSLSCSYPGCDYGPRELNPLMDDHPSNEEVLLFKIGFTGLLWGLGEIWPDHRETFYWIGTISGGAAAASNSVQYNKYRGEH